MKRCSLGTSSFYLCHLKEAEEDHRVHQKCQKMLTCVCLNQRFLNPKWRFLSLLEEMLGRGHKISWRQTQKPSLLRMASVQVGRWKSLLLWQSWERNVKVGALCLYAKWGTMRFFVSHRKQTGGLALSIVKNVAMQDKKFVRGNSAFSLTPRDWLASCDGSRGWGSSE